MNKNDENDDQIIAKYVFIYVAKMKPYSDYIDVLQLQLQIILYINDCMHS